MSFDQALSGLNAASQNLDVIGNNVSNANTVGFKSSTAQFADLYAGNLYGSTSSAVGIGTMTSAVSTSFTQGTINTTGNALDTAINGSGFFVLNQNGATTYSRDGQFQLNASGDIVTATGANVQGYPANALGVVTPSATPQNLTISTAAIPASATSTVTAGLNLDSSSTPLTAAGFNMADASTYNYATSINTYDSLGNTHSLSMYFVDTGPTAAGENAWKVFASNDGTQVGAAALGTLTFNSSGTLDAANSTVPLPISVPLANGATTPLAVNVDFSTTTQYGSTSVANSLTQNGFTTGSLSSYAVGANGTITGTYSNGQTKTLGQIALADFSSPDGLSPLSGNQFAATTASGAAVVGAAGTGSFGSLQGGALEQSNVDLTSALVNMITAQRDYQANAQTIKTEDQMLQTLVSLA